jgi:ubiquinone/menaquinone biosynthesis C-methylase UbiE
MLLAYSELKSPIIEEMLRLARSEVVGDCRKRTVELGYDSIVERYLAWSRRVQGDPRDRFLEAFEQRLPDGARVLDLGCGAGLPSTKQLARQFEVVGIDISEAQLRLARENVPTGTFIRGDFAELEMPAASFDGITALYSISHIPRDDHAGLFVQVARWLKPGGLLLASLGATGSPDWTGEWLGVPMFFSSHDADTNRQLIRNAGLSLVIDEIVSMQEPEGEAAFLWVLALKPTP